MNQALKSFLDRLEQPSTAFGGRGEMALVLAVLPLAFLHTLLDSLYGVRAVPGQSPLYLLLLSGFSAVALCSVLLLATPAGERRVRRLLERQRLLPLAALPAAYIGSYLLLLWLLGLPQLHTQALAMLKRPFSQLPLPVFLALAAALLTAGPYAALKLAMRRAAAAPEAERFFGVRELGCVLLAAAPFFLLQRHLPLVWCFTTPAAVVVMVYGTGLGREAFGLSFVPRSGRDLLLTLALLAAGVVFFLLLVAVSGRITYTGRLWASPWPTIYNAAFMWLMIVGISEEVIFRSGLLTMVAAYVGRLAAKKPGAAGAAAGSFLSSRSWLAAVLITSVLFGVVHLGRGPAFAALAFIASLLHGLAFVAGRSLAGPVLLHGILNVLILRNFQL